MTMVSSLLNHQPEFEQSKRNDLYYGKFRYCARFFLPEASALRQLDHDKIDSTLQFRRSWSNKVIADFDIQNVHKTCASLLALENPYKTTISVNWIYFYTNELSDIISLAQGPMRLNPQISQAEITHDKNTIPLLNPQHRFRTYFRSRKLDEQQFKALSEFLDANQEYVKTSDGMKSFFKRNRQTTSRWALWTMDYYYVDHSDMKFVTALSLINSGLVSKTKQIVMVNKT